MNPDRQMIQPFIDDPSKPLTVSGPPIAKALGCTLLSFEGEAGRLTASFEPSEFFLHGGQVIQGGATAAMLDLAFAFLSLPLVPADQSVATASLNISYLRAARPGLHIAEAEIEKRGKNLMFARASLRPEGKDEAVATATAVLSILK